MGLRGMGQEAEGSQVRVRGWLVHLQSTAQVPSSKPANPVRGGRASSERTHPGVRVRLQPLHDPVREGYVCKQQYLHVSKTIHQIITEQWFVVGNICDWSST